MAKKKKRGAQKAQAEIPSERLEELLATVDSLDPEQCSDAEFEALAEHYSKTNGGDPIARLTRLIPLVGNHKARVKTLKRLAFKLGQRGIDTSAIEIDEPPAGIRIAAESIPGSGLPVLLAPPNINAERRFSFALRRGPAVVAVEAVFKVRELYRLAAQSSSANQYRQWANNLCHPAADGTPAERVRVPPEWLERKFWEMGHYKRRGELGREVDHELLDMVTTIRAEPDHPIDVLDLDEGRPLSFHELTERPQRLHAFYHGSALAALRQQWYELGGSEHFAPGTDVARELRQSMEKAVGDWASQWGLDRVAEVVRDSALYLGLTGDLDAARTLHAVVDAESTAQRDDQLRAFLYDIAIWQLTR